MRVISSTTIRIGEPGEYREVPPGEPLSLPSEEAESLIERGLARVATTAPREVESPPSSGQSGGGGDGTDRIDEVLAATLELNEEDRSLFLDDGRPKVDALAAELGGPVSAEERDAAWLVLQAE